MAKKPLDKEYKSFYKKIVPMFRGSLSWGLRQHVVEMMQMTLEYPEYSSKIERIKEELTKLGFKEFEVELILDRYISNLSLEEITIKNGYTSSGVVNRLINTTLVKMRKLRSRIVSSLKTISTEEPNETK